MLTFWETQLEAAKKLTTEELWRHARVSLNNRCKCNDCFCCACVAVLRERENTKKE